MKKKKSLKLSMNEINNIKKYNKLGRRERKNIERRINKKLGKTSIKIRKKSFTKGESLNSEQRRNLMQDKDLIRELMKIIKKYLPQLIPLFSELSDKRNKSYIAYKIKTIILTRLFALICGITTMAEVNRRLNTENAIKNLSFICNQKLKKVPDWQTIQDVIEELNIKEIEDIRKYIVKALIRSKMFDKYRYNGAFQLVVDATGDLVTIIILMVIV